MVRFDWASAFALEPNRGEKVGASMRFESKVAIIIGVASGIGGSLAPLRFPEEPMRHVFGDINETGLVKTATDVVRLRFQHGEARYGHCRPRGRWPNGRLKKMVPRAPRVSDIKHRAYPRSILFVASSESSATRLVRWRSPSPASVLRRPVRVPCAGQTASGGSSPPSLGGHYYRALATEGSFVKGLLLHALSDLTPSCCGPSEMKLSQRVPEHQPL